MTVPDDQQTPASRRAHTSLPDGFWQMSEADQLAALEPFVDDLLGEDDDRG